MNAQLARVGTTQQSLAISTGKLFPQTTQQIAMLTQLQGAAGRAADSLIQLKQQGSLFSQVFAGSSKINIPQILSTQGVKEFSDRFNAELHSVQQVAVGTGSQFGALDNEITGLTSIQRWKIWGHVSAESLYQTGLKTVALGKNLQWTGRQMTIGLTLPILLAGTKMVQSFLRVNQAQTEFAKYVVQGGASAKEATVEVAGLNDELLKISVNTGLYLDQTTQLAAAWKATGIESDQQVIGLTDLTAKLTLLTQGEIDQAGAMELVRTVMSTWGLTLQQTQDQIQKITLVAGESSLTVGELGQAIPLASSAAQLLGINASQLAAILSGFREKGVSATQAATALRVALIKMVNPTGTVSDMWKNLTQTVDGLRKYKGTSITDFLYNPDGTAKGVKGLQDFSKAIGNGVLNAKQYAQFLGQLFGTRQVGNMDKLIKSLNNDQSQASRTLRDVGDSAKATSVWVNQLAVVQKSAAFAATQMRVEFSAILATLGATIWPYVQKVGKVILDLLNKFSSASSVTKNFIVGIGIALASLGPATFIVAQLTEALGVLRIAASLPMKLLFPLESAEDPFGMAKLARSPFGQANTEQGAMIRMLAGVPAANAKIVASQLPVLQGINLQIAAYEEMGIAIDSNIKKIMATGLAEAQVAAGINPAALAGLPVSENAAVLGSQGVSAATLASLQFGGGQNITTAEQLASIFKEGNMNTSSLITNRFEDISQELTSKGFGFNSGLTPFGGGALGEGMFTNAATNRMVSFNDAGLQAALTEIATKYGTTTDEILAGFKTQSIQGISEIGQSVKGALAGISAGEVVRAGTGKALPVVVENAEVLAGGAAAAGAEAAAPIISAEHVTQGASILDSTTGIRAATKDIAVAAKDAGPVVSGAIAGGVAEPMVQAIGDADKAATKSLGTMASNLAGNIKQFFSKEKLHVISPPTTGGGVGGIFSLILGNPLSAIAAIALVIGAVQGLPDLMKGWANEQAQAGKIIGDMFKGIAQSISDVFNNGKKINDTSEAFQTLGDMIGKVGLALVKIIAGLVKASAGFVGLLLLISKNVVQTFGEIATLFSNPGAAIKDFINSFDGVLGIVSKLIALFITLKIVTFAWGRVLEADGIIMQIFNGTVIAVKSLGAAIEALMAKQGLQGVIDSFKGIQEEAEVAAGRFATFDAARAAGIGEVTTAQVAQAASGEGVALSDEEIAAAAAQATAANTELAGSEALVDSLNPFTAMLVAITAVVAIILILTNRMDAMGAAIAQSMSQVQDQIQTLNNTLKDTKATAASVEGAFSSLSDTLQATFVKGASDTGGWLDLVAGKLKDDIGIATVLKANLALLGITGSKHAAIGAEVQQTYQTLLPTLTRNPYVISEPPPPPAPTAPPLGRGPNLTPASAVAVPISAAPVLTYKQQVLKQVQDPGFLSKLKQIGSSWSSMLAPDVKTPQWQAFSTSLFAYLDTIQVKTKGQLADIIKNINDSITQQKSAALMAEFQVQQAGGPGHNADADKALLTAHQNLDVLAQELYYYQTIGTRMVADSVKSANFSSLADKLLQFAGEAGTKGGQAMSDAWKKAFQSAMSDEMGTLATQLTNATMGVFDAHAQDQQDALAARQQSESDALDKSTQHQMDMLQRVATQKTRTIDRQIAAIQKQNDAEQWLQQKQQWREQQNQLMLKATTDAAINAAERQKAIDEGRFNDARILELQGLAQAQANNSAINDLNKQVKQGKQQHKDDRRIQELNNEKDRINRQLAVQQKMLQKEIDAEKAALQARQDLQKKALDESIANSRSILQAQIDELLKMTPTNKKQWQAFYDQLHTIMHDNHLKMNDAAQLFVDMYGHTINDGLSLAGKQAQARANFTEGVVSASLNKTKLAAITPQDKQLYDVLAQYYKALSSNPHMNSSDTSTWFRQIAAAMQGASKAAQNYLPGPQGGIPFQIGGNPLKHGGGPIEGPRGADVPITAQEGEFMIKRRRVQQLGHHFLTNLNEGRKKLVVNKKFHDGGLISAEQYSESAQIAPMMMQPALVGIYSNLVSSMSRIAAAGIHAAGKGIAMSVLKTLAPTILSGKGGVGPAPSGGGVTTMGWGGFRNGFIPLSAMTKVGGNSYLAPFAAKTFKAAERDLGDRIAPITSAYRTYQQQQDTYNHNHPLGLPAALPGYSMHGWGEALDLGAARNVEWFRHNSYKYKWYPGDSFGDPYHFSYGISAHQGGLLKKDAVINAHRGETILNPQSSPNIDALAMALTKAIGNTHFQRPNMINPHMIRQISETLNTNRSGPAPSAGDINIEIKIDEFFGDETSYKKLYNTLERVGNRIQRERGSGSTTIIHK